MTSHKGAASIWRDDVLLELHGAGFSSAYRRPEMRGIPDEARVCGDILGLPLTIAVRSSVTPDLSSAQNEAQREAAAEGKDFFVSVQHRRGYPTSEAYATTSPVPSWACSPDSTRS